MLFKNLLWNEISQCKWLIWIGLTLIILNVFLVVFSYGLVGGVIKGVKLDIQDNFKLNCMTPDVPDEFTYYIWSQWNAKSLSQLGVIFVIFLATTQFVGENSRKNISFLLSRPVGRKLVFLSKSSAGVLVILFLFGVGAGFLWIFSELFHYQAAWSRILLSGMLSIVWLILFYLLGCLLSILTSIPLTAGLAIIGVGFVLSIPGWFEALREFSIFYQMRAITYFLKGAFPLVKTLIAVFLGGGLYYIAQNSFVKRDYA